MAVLRDIADALDGVNEVTTPRFDGAHRVGSTGSTGPVGAPSQDHATNVLLTLRSRLQAQIEAEDEYESAETRAILADARYRLAQVNEALERMELGKYGQCADCGTQINADRLVIQPFATRCLGCQERHDLKVRRAPSHR